MNLGAEFSNYEISPSPTEPPDVLFREARFEVKEIMDEGRKRHDEVKKSLQQAIQAKKPEDLIESYSPRDIAFTEIYPIVKTRSQRLTSKYSADIRKTIDLLYYVNLEDVHGYISQPLPDMADLVLLGFRSISFVLGRHAGILTANSDAPILLTGYTPRIQRRG